MWLETIGNHIIFRMQECVICVQCGCVQIIQLAYFFFLFLSSFCLVENDLGSDEVLQDDQGFYYVIAIPKHVIVRLQTMA